MEEFLYLQISESRMDEIRKIVVGILRDSGAKCGLLMDSGGRLLIRKGFTLIREIDSLCALIAAQRATTREIAKILGQQNLSVVFYQGSGDHLHSTDVGDRAILTLIFDDRADLSKIQKIASERVSKIEPLLKPADGEDAGKKPGIDNLRLQADKRLDVILGSTPATGEGGQDAV